MFGATSSSPFRAQGVQHRADRLWEAAKLTRLTFHDCRHTYASLMIAAGCNAKALSTFNGAQQHPDHDGPLRPPDARQ